MLFDISEKLLAFREKLKWKRKILSQKAVSFFVFNQLLNDIEEVCFDDVHLIIEKDLASLIQKFD